MRIAVLSWTLLFLWGSLAEGTEYRRAAFVRLLPSQMAQIAKTPTRAVE